MSANYPAFTASGVVLPIARRQATTKVLMRLMVLALLSLTMLQPMGINLGSYSANLVFLTTYGVLLYAVFSHKLVLVPIRAVFYVACMSFAIVGVLVSKNLSALDRSSMPSLLLLMVIYFPLVFAFKEEVGEKVADEVRHAFLTIAFICALFGIGQFLLQFVIKDRWLFAPGSLLPNFMKGPGGFNTVIPVGSLYKSNGFFFREPSGFSFFMALGLLLEMATTKRWRYIAAFGAALLLSYSGTGIFAFAVGLILPLRVKMVVRIGLVAMVVFILANLPGDPLNLAFTLGRVGEFDSEASSAYIRYIAPGRLIGDTMLNVDMKFWFGHGPGTIMRGVERVGYEFHDPTWAKLIFEYGFVGLLLFCSFMISLLVGSRVPLQVRLVLFVSWLMMGGHLLSPESVFLNVLLVGLFTMSRWRDGRPTLQHQQPAIAPALPRRSF